MKEVFAEVSDEAVMRESDPAVSPPPALDPNHDVHVCPFCGLTRQINEEFDPSAPCPRCTLADTPVTRNATKVRIGPWHVRQVRNPWAPGMRFETLVALVKRGQVTKDSIVRGPTSHQLWKRAAEIKGLSREFGICYSCGGTIDKQANLCAHCNRLQEPPINPDMLVEAREPAERPAASASANPKSPPASKSRSAVPPSPAGATPPLEMRSAASSLRQDPLAADTIDDSARARELTSRPPQSRTQPAPRARTPTSEDALLTPKDLAAAFKLDFVPGSGKHRRGKIIAVLLLLAIGIAAAALFYNRPDYRKQASDAIESGVNRVKVFLASRERKKGTTRPASPVLPPVTYQNSATEHATGRPSPEPIAKSSPVESSAVKSLPSLTPSKSAEAAPPHPVATPVIAKANPVGTSSAATAAPSTGATSSSVPAVPAPVVAPTPPVAVVPHAPASTAKPAAAAELPTDPVERVRVLWRKALDADANQDYLEEVQCYEQIEKLPDDLHPAGLDMRLELARKLLK